MVTIKDVKRAILLFASLKDENKKADDSFNEAKSKFYKKMDAFFDNIDSNSFEFIHRDDEGETLLKVTKVTKVNIVWRLPKLKRVLGPLYKSVVVKDVKVIDYEGLAVYVKKLGGEAKTFKRFFSVVEHIDTAALDSLSEVGEIDASRVSECCDVKFERPWYKVSTKRIK